jgi:putative FmdB family regulatory protein
LPLYEYECPACQQVTEVRHGSREAFAGTCAACGGALKRVFNAAGIVFKGSGFYVTDSRKAASKSESSASPASSGEAAAKKTESGGDGTAAKTESSGDGATKKTESSGDGAAKTTESSGGGATKKSESSAA